MLPNSGHVRIARMLRAARICSEHCPIGTICRGTEFDCPQGSAIPWDLAKVLFIFRSAGDCPVLSLGVSHFDASCNCASFHGALQFSDLRPLPHCARA
jgi:hypothetical protein